MKNLQTIIILVLVAVILWLTQCNRVECPDITETIVKDSIIYVPEIRYEVKTKYSTIVKTKTDTVRLYDSYVQYITPEKDYYIKRFYSDTITLDSLGHIIIEDTVFMNKIKVRRILRNFKAQNIVTLTPKKRANELYLGFGISSSRQQFKTLTIDALLTRKRNAYSIGFGIDNDFNYVYKGSIYFKL